MNIEITIEYAAWEKIKDIRSIANECIVAVFSELEYDKKDAEICFLFTDDDEVRALNKTFRGIDKPTNVLSFPTGNPLDDVANEDYYCDCNDDDNHEDCECCCHNSKTFILGSIALAFETIEKESIEQNKSMENHLRHLIVHSILHLFGYIHDDDSDAKKMESLEIKILKGLHVSSPY